MFIILIQDISDHVCIALVMDQVAIIIYMGGGALISKIYLIINKVSKLNIGHAINLVEHAVEQVLLNAHRASQIMHYLVIQEHVLAILEVDSIFIK
jgi:hypothetical protein